MNHCKCRRLEGNLAVPATWPANSSSGMKAYLAGADHVRFLQNRVASLSLKDTPAGSSYSRCCVLRDVGTLLYAGADVTANHAFGFLVLYARVSKMFDSSNLSLLNRPNLCMRVDHLDDWCNICHPYLC
ncbi:hypothetical protein ACSBR2_024547 [Camellia fascicularis]